MGTPGLKVTGINHVVLHVSNMEKSRDFYIGILGFVDRNATGASHPKRSFLLCGMQGIDLFEVSDDIHAGKEMNHMALNLAAQELEAVIAELATVGIESSERTQRNSVFISDPDGHQIELLPHEARERERETASVSAS